MKTHVVVLRWIAVLPAAIACYFVAYGFLKLTSFFAGISNDGDLSLSHIYIPIVASGFAGYCFIVVGSMVAPSNKKIAALVLLIFVVLLAGMAALLLFAKPFKWVLFFETVGQTVGAAISYYRIQNDLILL